MGWRRLILASIAFLALGCARCQSSDGQNNTITAAFQDISCTSDVLTYPSSTQEVAAQIKSHLKAAAAAGVGLKVRVSHRNFHSSSSFPCPSQMYDVYPTVSDNPLLASQHTSAPKDVTTVSLLFDNMTRMLSMDAETHQVRVQAGMLITHLLHEAAKANMSCPLGAVPAFGDLTLGGVLVTGAHGSGHLATSSLGDILLELTWVDGNGDVHVSPRNSSAGNALVAGLGVAGVVTELLLQLHPYSHTQLNTRFKQSDVDILADVKAMLQESPHVLVVWRPDLKKYTAHVTQEVSSDVPVTGALMDLDLPKAASQALGAALAAWQKDVHDRNALAALPVWVASQEMSIGHAMAKNIYGGRMFDGVGDTNDMQAAHCGDKCLWFTGAKIGMDDIHFSIELEMLGEWIDDVKKLMVADLWEYGKHRRRSLSPGYFWFRFGHGSQDFLSHTSGMKAPVHVQMSFMKAMHNPLVPTKWPWILQLIEQFTLCKYQGKPHWGKNHQRTFQHPTCHIPDYLPYWDKMMSFTATSDPQGIFKPQLFEDMAGRVPNTYSAGCELRGECYCTEDSHCAPGYKCEPSLAFPEYKACRL